ncbi:MAG TPA: radical SAM protein [Elusimicrobiales bacterium]|nr:radical SAM protein [Elusimicrobiales bacterium]
MKILIALTPGLPPTVPIWALAHLKAFLESRGHEARVADYNVGYGIASIQEGGRWWEDSYAERYFSSDQRILRDIEAYNADIVALCSFRDCLSSTLYVARHLKRLKNPPYVIIGGPYSCRIARRAEFADAIIPGEAENSLLDVISLLEKKRPRGPIPGVILFKGEDAVYGGPPIETKDLDALPFPDFTGMDLSGYSAKAVPFSFNRGCANKCNFCTTAGLWPNFRSHSAKRIYEEMLNTAQRFGAKHMFASCTSVASDIPVLEELCDRIIAGGVWLSWEAMAAFRKELTLPLLHKMKKAGCAHLGFGLESGSDKMLAKMGKPYTAGIAEQVIRNCAEAGLALTVNVILGFPGETAQDVELTKAFLSRNIKYIPGGVAFPHECGIGGRSPMNLNPLEYGVRPDSLSDRLAWESADGKQTHQSRQELIRKFLEWAKKEGVRVGGHPADLPGVHSDSPQDPPPFSPA